jgi:hypothetical protein
MPTIKAAHITSIGTIQRLRSWKSFDSSGVNSSTATIVALGLGLDIEIPYS